MNEPENAAVVVCGRCGYFKLKSVAAGTCRHYGRAVYSSTECLASGKAEADLPHCQSCGKSVQPSRTAKSGSKYCAGCWEIESQRHADENLRRENRYLTRGLELAASANNGCPARSVAWCTYALVRHQEQSQNDTGAAVGAALGGFVGALVGAAIDSAKSPGAVTYDASIALFAVTDTELLCLDLGRCNLGSAPRLTVQHIQSLCQDEEVLAAMKVARFPLAEIRPESADMSIKFEFEGKARQVDLAAVPEIPHQPTPEAMLRAIREAGAPLPLTEFMETMISGPPAFTAAFWRPVATIDSYWEDLSSSISSARLNTDNVVRFLSADASSIPELQADSRYIDLLWLLFQWLPTELQQELAHDWRDPQPHFVTVFIEKARKECQPGSLGNWLTRRKYKRLESILTTGK